MNKARHEKYSRPPIGRMNFGEWIRCGKYPNAVTMARDLEVTGRTVMALSCRWQYVCGEDGNNFVPKSSPVPSV